MSTTSATTSSGSGGSGGSGGSAPCTATLAGGPAAAPYPFSLGGQSAWSHDDGYPAGYFHTYDALDVGGSAPHKVHVMLPRNYGPCDAGYPVVYMNDGSGVFWNNPFSGKSWRVPDALHDLYAAGAIPEVIVVAIEPNDRNAEYSPTEVAPDQTCCGADQYTAYVADHVKAFIDANYRTAPGRETTVMVGSSRGGLSSFYLATRRPEVFGSAICMSSSFWAGLDPVYGGTYPGGPLATAPLVVPVESTLSDAAIRPRLWIDWGLVRTGGFQNEVIEAAATTRGKEMVALLEGTYGYVEGKEIFWEEDPMGEHDENSWARRFPGAMKAMLGK
jgi:pimeloyl-ACP methyl ester carboxylesterase